MEGPEDPATARLGLRRTTVPQKPYLGTVMRRNVTHSNPLAHRATRSRYTWYSGSRP